MKHTHTPFCILCVVALIPTEWAEPSSETPEASAQEQALSEVIEIPRQLLVFKPTRDDISVGCVVFSLHRPNRSDTANALRVNGVEPKSSALYLKRVGKNQFELPAQKIEFSSQQLGGPLYLTIKPWFNEITNQHDSPFYKHTPDRYALISYCTNETDDSSRVNARLGANRETTLKAFIDRLGKPFVIELNQRPLREEYGQWPMINNAGRRLSDTDLAAVEKLVRDRGERYVITISTGNGSDRAYVHVGDHDLFEAARRYHLARTDGVWRIQKIDEIESGW